MTPSPPPPLDRSTYPHRFGRFVLLKELGHGGMGQVFMAVMGQTGVERVCALKIIKDLTADRDNEDLGRRFLDEAKVVTKLSHENLVYVFDFGLVRSQGYLAMEYVAGKTLTEVWNRCAQRSVGFPLGVSLFLVSELCAGLGYAHALGGLHLVHRDVSPSNVMISYTGGIKLIDFGLAKWKSKAAQTATGINWGKMSYMSPEQYLGRPLDRRSDLYSAGVILWELLTGRQLFPSTGARDKEPVITPPSKINGNLFPDLDAVVMKALALDPKDRYQSGEEMSAAVSAHLPREAGKLEVAEFLRGLFEADVDKERTEQDRLVEAAADLGAGQGAPAAGNAAPQGPAGHNAAPRGHAADAASDLDEPSDPFIGATLGDRYYVRRLIGEGAMGRVYEGHHTGVGKRVAIKIPRRPERRRAELLQRFRLEANAASQIGHPNIADVTDCGTAPDGSFFFVMELIDGVDLDKLVRRDGQLPIERALLVALQVARALEAAHKAGIIHRDLKPSNVMVVRDRDGADFIKVLDFGVAKFLRSEEAGGEGSANLTMSDAAVGTPRYMAPEQIEAGRAIDFRADIYALGGIMFFMLSGGQAPHEGDSVQNVWRRKMLEEPTPLRRWRSDVPPGVESLVMRCLARDPVNRPESMEALKKEIVKAEEALRAASSSLLGMRVPSSTAVIAPRPSDDAAARTNKKRRAGIVVLGLAGTVIVGAVSVQALRPRADDPTPSAAARQVAPASITVPPTPGPAPVVALAAETPPAVAPAPAAASVPPPAPASAPPPAPASAPPPAPASVQTQAPASTQPAPARPPAVKAAPPSDAERERQAKVNFDRAYVLYQEARYADAIRLAEVVLEETNDRELRLKALLLVAKSRRDAHQPREAAEAYEEALNIDGDNKRAREGLEKARAQIDQTR